MVTETTIDQHQPIRVPLEASLAGFPMEVIPKGESGPVLTHGILLPWNGDQLYTALDSILGGLFGSVLANRGIDPYGLRTFLIWQENATEALVWPFLKPVAKVQLLRPQGIEAGEPLYDDDIGRIIDISFDGFELPKAGTFLFLTSQLSRRALAFDFRGVRANFSTRPAFRSLACKAMNCLRFREQILLSPNVRVKMVRAGWHLFSRLGRNLTSMLSQAFTNNRHVEAIEGSIVEHFFIERIRAIATGWWNSHFLEKRRKWIEAGLERYFVGDMISAVSNLFPQIEGSLRDALPKSRGTPPRSHAGLVGAVRRMIEHNDTPYGGFFAEYFCNYLDNYIFRDSDFYQELLPFSRHTVAHGIAPADLVSSIRVLQLILTLDEIHLMLSPASQSTVSSC